MASGRRGSPNDFKGFAKNKEVAKINKAVIETETKFVLGVNGDDMEEC